MKIAFSILAVLVSSMAALPTLAADCPRCIEARENNKKMAPPPHYYEDYLKQQEEES
jgi:hypothetical protein